MKTLIITVALLASTLSLATTIGSTPAPTVAPVGSVIVLDDEVEIEWLPDVTVEVVHSEVEINGQVEG